MCAKPKSPTGSQKTEPPSWTAEDEYTRELDDIIMDIGDPQSGDLAPKTPYSIVEAVAVLMYTAREARRRITKEGSVVRDMKGAVVPHPALAIEAAAIKQYTDLVAKHARPGTHR